MSHGELDRFGAITRVRERRQTNRDRHVPTILGLPPVTDHCDQRRSGQRAYATQLFDAPHGFVLPRDRRDLPVELVYTLVEPPQVAVRRSDQHSEPNIQPVGRVLAMLDDGRGPLLDQYARSRCYTLHASPYRAVHLRRGHARLPRVVEPVRRIGIRTPLPEVNTAASCSLITSSNVWPSSVAIKLRRASFRIALSVQDGSTGQP